MTSASTYEYNSRMVRQAALKLKNCANALSNGTRPKINRMRSELPSNMEGKAADALGDRLTELNADVNAMVGSMRNLSRTLETYAAELERTARELRQLMS